MFKADGNKVVGSDNNSKANKIVKILAKSKNIKNC